MKIDSTSQQAAQAAGEGETARSPHEGPDARVAGTSELTRFVDPLRVPSLVRVGNECDDGWLKISMRAARVRLHSQLPKTSVVLMLHPRAVAPPRPVTPRPGGGRDG